MREAVQAGGGRGRAGAYGRGLALIALGGVAFGSIGIGSKYAVEGGATILTILLIRYTVAAALLWLALPLAGLRMRLPGSHALGFVLLGAIPHAVGVFGFNAALRTLSVGATVLLLYTYPALVVAVLALSGREPLTRGRALAVLAALDGCALVVGSLGEERFDLAGVGFAALSALGAASYVLIGDRLLVRVNPLVAAAHLQAGTAFSLLVVAALFGGLDLRLSAQASLGIAAVALLGNVVGMTALFAGMRRVGASVAAVGSMLEVVVSVTLGALLFGESLGPARLVGAALILAAIWLIQREGRRQAAGSLARAASGAPLAQS